MTHLNQTLTGNVARLSVSKTPRPQISIERVCISAGSTCNFEIEGEYFWTRSRRIPTGTSERNRGSRPEYALINEAKNLTCVLVPTYQKRQQVFVLLPLRPVDGYHWTTESFRVNHLGYKCCPFSLTACVNIPLERIPRYAESDPHTSRVEVAEQRLRCIL